jgi:uncharacterized protein
MHTNYEEQLKNIVLSHINLNDCLVFLFGSRAKLNHRQMADFDIGLYSHHSLHTIIPKIREEIEESMIPFPIDLVDFRNVDINFKKQALKDVKIWNQPKSITLDMSN